jgi:hypothetical protein
MKTDAPDLCKKKKCGEYNMLKCVRTAEHIGDCCFVVDHENDYPWNKNKQPVRKTGRRVK